MIDTTKSVEDEINDAKVSEKLRLRQEKWQKMKQEINTNTKVMNTEESEQAKKKRLRQEKLEAWKRKKEQEKLAKEKPQSLVSSTKSIIKSKLKFGTKIIKEPVKKRVIGSVFGGFEENEVEIPKKKLKLPTDQEDDLNNDDANEDSLDKFFNELKDGQQADNNTEILEDEEQVDYQEDDQQENVSDIINKLNPDKSKKVFKVNHEEIDYPPFKRDFYKESEDVKLMTQEEVEILRLDLDGIKVTGKFPPNPITNWQQLGLPSNYMSSLINDLKLLVPTPIQSQSIPAILQGRDIIGIAKTGSGKSLSFLLPLFRHVKFNKNPQSKDPAAIILVPTRELAMQIHGVSNLIDNTMKSVPIFGGENIAKQIAKIKNGVDLVIATPGRLIDLLTLKKMKLSGITFLVIDEADRMFDMGFQPQINMIVDGIRKDCQKVLFSATFPIKLEKLARKILVYNPLEIKIGLKGVNDDVKQLVEVLNDNEEKFLKILGLLGDFFNNGTVLRSIDSSLKDNDKVLVFVDKQESADRLSKRLNFKGYECESLHGGRNQSERDSIINNFKKSKTKLLIATSIAARGLDVPSLKLVINYDCPNHIEDYIHRAGRTGRAGEKGIVVTYLLSTQDRAVYDIVKAFKLSNLLVPENLQKLADEFYEKIKKGKERFFTGFGGNGLDKLDSERDEKKKQIKQIVENTEEKKISTTDASSIKKQLSQISDFQVVEGKAESSPDSGAFHSIININDLPQNVRWQVTNRDAIKRIIEDTSCAITSKGRFYKEGEGPVKKNDEPKLYLLVEGDSRVQVASAVEIIKESIIESMKNFMISENSKPVGGRYTVA